MTFGRMLVIAVHCESICGGAGESRGSKRRPNRDLADVPDVACRYSEPSLALFNHQPAL